MTPPASHRVEAVGGPKMQFNCVSCGRQITSGGYREVTHGDDVTRAYADLDGKPWVDYYCGPCAKEKGAKI